MIFEALATVVAFGCGALSYRGICGSDPTNKPIVGLKLLDNGTWFVPKPLIPAFNAGVDAGRKSYRREIDAKLDSLIAENDSARAELLEKTPAPFVKVFPIPSHAVKREGSCGQEEPPRPSLKAAVRSVVDSEFGGPPPAEFADKVPAPMPENLPFTRSSVTIPKDQRVLPITGDLRRVEHPLHCRRRDNDGDITLPVGTLVLMIDRLWVNGKPKNAFVMQVKGSRRLSPVELVCGKGRLANHTSVVERGPNMLGKHRNTRNKGETK